MIKNVYFLYGLEFTSNLRNRKSPKVTVFHHAQIIKHTIGVD